jgi:sugar phosphate isomerase/epimerase
MKIQADPPLLSVPSWVIAGSYAENLRFLKDKSEIQGVELLFFLYNDEIRELLDSEWDEILSYRKRFIFTAHLPDLLLPEHEELVSRLAPLVRHFIVHPALENPMAQARLLAEWEELYRAIFLVENTRPGLLEALLPHLGANAGLCMDTGHLLLEGQSPADYFRNFSEHIGEIHLHSVDLKQAAIDGRLPDHRQLREEPWLLELLSLLGDYRGAINLEVFSWEEARAGIEILQMEQKTWQKQ